MPFIMYVLVFHSRVSKLSDHILDISIPNRGLNPWEV